MRRHDHAKAIVGQLWPVIEQDAQRALEAALTGDDPYSRRMAFRAVFAAVEGSVHGLKQVVLAGIESQRHRYTDAEIAMLREEAYSLDDRGVAGARGRFLPLDANIRFAFDMIIREANLPLGIDWAGDGWHALKRSLEVRHRVTHPKLGTDVEVSPEEVSDLSKVYEWFRTSVGRTLARALLSAREKNYRLLDRLLGPAALEVLDFTDPEGNPALVDAARAGDAAAAVQEVLKDHGIARFVDEVFELTESGRDYLRWRRDPWSADTF